MSSDNGTVLKYITAIALLIFLIPSREAKCQEGILDSAFTFRAGTIKTGNALNLLPGKQVTISLTTAALSILKKRLK